MVESDNDSCVERPSDRDAKRNEYNLTLENAPETCQDLYDALLNIGGLFQHYNLAIDVVESELHDIWDELIHAAKVLPADSSEHDRLVLKLIQLRELGLLARHRDIRHQDDLGLAAMPNGQRLWLDLPYLALDLQTYWASESMALSPNERESLAALTSKMFALGLCTDDLAVCALWIFQNALETELPVGRRQSVEAFREDSPILLPEILPACLAWLMHGQFRLAKLSVEDYSPKVAVTTVSIAPGPLAIAAGVIGEGFSLPRWLFWRKRFGELYLSGDKLVSGLARKCFDLAVSAGRLGGLDIPGESAFYGNAVKALHHERVARGIQTSLDLTDIDIDPTWTRMCI